MSGEGFPIIGIGASAGGLEAIRSLFGGHKGKTGMAFVVVQHLDPTHESLMAQLIERYTSMPVSQATGGEKVVPDHVYVIPPGHGLALEDGSLELTEFKDPRGMRRPIDDFFESLAEDRDGNAACVILSGTGADGSRGLRAIKEHGGLCIAQDPESAAYDGMPTAAISTGLVDVIASPAEMIDALKSFFERAPLHENFLNESGELTDHLEDLCSIVRDTSGHDFSRYKKSTLLRRIARRMQLLGVDRPADYLSRLREDESECSALFQDLLINVTRFFRDREQFEALNELVIEPLVAQSKDQDELRVWVPGCSSGEEAYTIAMLFAAAARRQRKNPYVQIFATDIDEKMLEIARSATYPLAALEDIPIPMRDHYTVGGTDRFTIAAHIRDMVRFSQHNVVRDPPFSKIDLISCRNVLIYFNESLQKSIIPLFHFSLGDDGRLFLGSSEAIGRFEDLFEVIDQTSRIFRRKDVQSRYSLQLAGDTRKPHKRLGAPAGEERRPRANSAEIMALQLVARRYAPVSLLVDKEGMLLERWGAAGRYLDFPERLERNVHVPSLARPGLRELIAPLIRKVSQSQRRAGANDVQIRTDFGTLGARVICEPLEEGSFLLVIEDTSPLEVGETDFDEFDMEDGQTQFLEEELQATRHRLRSTIEELETTNEELKSSNEEMMSMNEELQSTNEELTTVNDELKNKVDQLTVANADLKNFFDSTQLPVLVVDGDLRLRSYTEAATELFQVDQTHIGEMLGDLPNQLAGGEYIEVAARASRRGENQNARVTLVKDQAEYMLRAVPYRQLDDKIDGATLVFTNVTEALSLERDLKQERERLRLALDVAKIGVWEYEPATDITVLDEMERTLLNIKDDDAGDRMEPILAALPPEDRDRVNLSLRRAMDGERDFDEVFRVPLDDGGLRWLHGLGRLIEAYGIRKFIGVTFDISAERSALEQRELMIREMNHRVKNLFSVISAMVSIAARDADDIQDFAEQLRGRIFALGRSHSLTTSGADGDGGTVSLRSLIETVVLPSKSSQTVDLKGDSVVIPNSQITSLALILHEWATNSTKYGAFANENGKLEVEWSQSGDSIVLDWAEKGRADVDESQNKAGFGTRLVSTATRQLNGTMTTDQADDTYCMKLTFPLAQAD
ncbi:CheR family methyltransferase [Erythrobacter sp. HKB08]|uniref:CheR family methyltransferase n=1 Tax=Erythrobacter sp. HKB08 TaxID=2502843 RepID=UPI0010088FD9|nr:CheR family methyltransferase [Erythrobacter sp. HKB08]